MIPSARLSSARVPSDSPRSPRSAWEIALAVTPARPASSCWLKPSRCAATYNECAYTNPLGNAQVAAHATGTFGYSSPAISGSASPRARAVSIEPTW